MGKPKDSIETVKTDLQIQEELDAHEKGWSAQKAGVAFIFGMMLLAAAGVFGNGPASKTRITKEEITVESERFFRRSAPMELKVHIMNAETDNVTVTFQHQYLQNFQVQSIVPEPIGNKTLDGQVSYSFQGNAPMRITFYKTAEAQGAISGDLRVNGKPFHLKTFIFP